jgi:hypothetical protein
MSPANRETYYIHTSLKEGKKNNIGIISTPKSH